MILLTWTQFKALIDSKFIVDYAERNNGEVYFIYGFHFDESFLCQIPQTDPDFDSDQTDYETNYQVNAGVYVPPKVRLTDGTTTVNVTPNGDLEVSDGLSNGGVNGNLNLTTHDVAYEAKVGGSRLTNRKSLTVQAKDFDIYWGYSSSVTTSNGTLLNSGDMIIFDCDPATSFQVWLVASVSNKNARITESP